MKNKTLQEILELLKEQFPKVKEKTLIKIIFALKSRNDLYGNGNIGLSRLEHDDFGVGEATLQKIIYFLRNFGIIEKVGERKIKTRDKKEERLCNIYKIADFFVSMLNELEYFSKHIFEYINPIEFVRKYFKPVLKYGLYKFKVNGNRYYINTKGKFRGVIFGESENKIINPLELLT